MAELHGYCILYLMRKIESIIMDNTVFDELYIMKRLTYFNKFIKLNHMYKSQDHYSCCWTV